MSEKKIADFWFDPACPWAWMTSRWALEVEKVRDVTFRWNVMSLWVLNRDKLDELPDSYRELLPRTKPAVRVCTAVAHKYDNETLGALYTALGTEIHIKQNKDSASYIPAALAQVGLPAELATVGDTDSYDEALVSSHNRGIDLVGQDVGTPVIAVDGPDGDQVAFFGPVVTPAPKGEAAGRLWDGTILVAATPGFYEIKRTRHLGPIFD
ncbi:disulfide bond formation protein DsbA [Natronoglycomyces albus]|uniref:Disulfide bond formation protein DsbA n=1 Tax=Natronoglycomyces albus TaxID=2811108 RepID=A0A895XRV1_9ACTN|nr:disulfide bond formation protein DsbA [Natronoglycomyces albus]QSB06253.1 disulfide bond formation protein DsbA [Natronoglycomyces albus]